MAATAGAPAPSSRSKACRVSGGQTSSGAWASRTEAVQRGAGHGLVELGGDGRRRAGRAMCPGRRARRRARSPPRPARPVRARGGCPGRPPAAAGPASHDSSRRQPSSLAQATVRPAPASPAINTSASAVAQGGGDRVLILQEQRIGGPARDALQLHPGGGQIGGRLGQGRVVEHAGQHGNHPAERPQQVQVPLARPGPP